MDAENKLQRILELNRARQAHYYEKHKAEINAKRRENYTHKKINKPFSPKEESKEDLGKKHKIDFNKSKSISYEETINALNTLDISDGSRLKYKNDIKRLLTLTDCSNIITCFKDYKKLIEVINLSKKPNNEPYSVNTKKGLYQMILFLTDNLHIPISSKIKQQYNKQFEIYKISSSDHTKEKQENVLIPSFDDYLKFIKDKFGENSKEYVLSKLYSEITLRDDYKLKIISSSKEATDEKENYIIVPKSSALTLIINHYKTSNKYGQIKVKISLPLSKIIRNYIKREKLVFGDYLFGNKPLTSFVSKFNKQIGINGGISLYRQMSISDLLHTNPNAEERQKLAEIMKHAPLTQLKYLHNNI
jgi:hypothetical protein